MGWRARDVGEGKGRGGWEQDGMRGGVGKGARGVVQFRVGITLDFRGDVATSPALLLLYPPSRYHPSPPPLPSAASNLPLNPLASRFRASVSSVLPFQRAKATHPSYYGERAPRLSERDRSFRALPYIPSTAQTYRVGWYFSFFLVFWPRRDRSSTTGLVEEGRAIMSRQIYSLFFLHGGITPITLQKQSNIKYVSRIRLFKIETREKEKEIKISK